MASAPAGTQTSTAGDLLGPQAGEHETLLSAHAASREHDRFAIPVGPGQQIIQGPRVAQVHVQEIRFLAIGVANGLIVPRDVAGSIGRQLVVRIDVDQQPAFGGTLRGAARVQRVHARILQLDERGKLAFPGRFGDVAMRLGSERVQYEHVQLDARHIGLDLREDRVDRDLGLRGEFAVPECVEIAGTRRREPDLRRRDGGADRVESVVAAGVASDVTGSLSGWGVRLHRDVDHLRLVAGDFDLVLARGKIELAFLENHRIIAPDRPLVGVGGRDRDRALRSSPRFRRRRRCRWRGMA